ncbi:DUF6531 domain-containing protein [Streptomyces millisiae]|uniref:DUF6531 domain-containing protein n=1 Tax=Streptomyces millisiae TaxID=3075542 RepID=A0ABU2LRK3_9ACTN|nr:DUF6531 domain-containing protein [Streptomyces sp. DSM 44918]MDT0320227.1 DUF6531 domain-containing protein [Streptomyces sp. DSM 44918]
MARPADWSPVDMDSDPTPGSPDEVRELADELQTFADDVGEALGRIRGMAEDRAVQDWAGLSAERFRSEFDGVPGNLQKLQTSYDMAAQALQTYWPKLETAQGMADRALDRAIAAQADLSAAQAALTDAQDWVSRAGDEAERLQEAGEREGVEPPSEAEVRAAARDATAAGEAASSAQGRVDDAEERLTAARALAQQAREMREEAARVCADDIDAASDAGIQNRSWWENLVRWVQDAWDTIVAICKVVVAVLGVIALIIGGPIAWVVLAAAVVVLADTLIKFANGEASLWDVAFAALDCIPGMRGLTTLGGLARGIRGLASTGLHGLTAGVRGLAQGFRGSGRIMSALFCRSDPVDMATGDMVMSATDVELPGVLPLVLSRHHRTSVTTGRLFGPSWTSTLDQRLVLADDGVRLHAEDGMTLHYPRPIPGEPVLPVEGPRWELSWSGESGAALTVHQREAGLTLTFRPVAGRPGPELPLTEIGDRHANRVRVEYGAHGDPTALVHDGGHRVGIATVAHRVRELRLLSDPDQPVLRRYEYDDAGRLAAIRDSSGAPQRISHDELGRITGWRDRNDGWYRYAYSPEGRCVGTEGAGGFLASRIDYDPENRRTLFTDSLGHTTVYQFDDCYQLVAETDPLGNTTRRTFDRYDRPLTVTDPLGNTTRHEYDAHGNTTTVVRPDGSRLAVERDASGLPLAVTEPDGRTWRWAYDERGNRTAETDPLGLVTRYRYDERGGPAAVTDPGGDTVTIECDPLGLPVAVRDPDGGVTRYRYDHFGRVTRVTDPEGGVDETEWTPEGQPARHRSPDGAEESWEWDGEGNCLRYTDPTGATVTTEYGPFGLLTARTNAHGLRSRHTWDTECRPLTVTDSTGATWRYAYDAAGNLVAEHDFDGHTLTYAYDAAGRLTGRTNAVGQHVAYHRDPVGRIVGKDTDGSHSVFEYDASGRLVRAASDHTEVRYERDPLGRVLAEIRDGRTLAYEYDPRGRVTRRHTPGGVTSTWSYPDDGRSTRLLSAGRVVEFVHDALGREVERRVGPGLSLASRWRPGGGLAELTVRHGAREPRRRSYAYRADGHPSGITDSLTGHTEIRLDGAGRVTSLSAPGWEESYAYDTAGNQTDAHWPAAAGAAASTGEREYEGTRVVRAGHRRYEYDAAGRLVVRRGTGLAKESDTWRYEWDAEDRLTAVTTPDGTRWEYRYDPLGRRVAKSRLAPDGSVAERTEFVWSGTLLVEQLDVDEESRATSSTTWEYRGHHPVLQIEGRAAGGDPEQAEYDRRFLAIVTDLVGAPAQLVDDAGEIVWEPRVTLWGAASPTPPGAPDTPLRFPGQYHDPETGLHQNFHRYYDPETARYLTPDPLGLGPGPNPRAYPHNPQVWADPLGLLGCQLALFHGTFGAAARNIRTAGINLTYSMRAMDFGRGGFYVTNDLAQARQWANRLAGRNGDVAEVLHFRVPQNELTSFNRRVFDGPSSELADFIRHHRNGGAMHDYDLVEGPMLMNVGPFLRRGADPVFGGHQIAIFSPEVASLFNRSLLP